MKPTMVYTAIGGVLLFGLLTGRNLLEAVLGTAYPGLSQLGWRKLTRNWAIFFLVMAVVNEAVWRSTTTEFWIGFKLWFFIPATFLFALANVPMLMKHGLTIADAEAEPPIPPSQ
jgi:intracellular septation protein